MYIFLLHTVSGASQRVEVTFRPDKSRFLPYREEIQVQKSAKSFDEILRIGFVGRVRDNQLYVTPAQPIHEPFARSLVLENNEISISGFHSNDDDNRPNMENINENSPNIIGQGIFFVDDTLSSTTNNEMKKAIIESLKYSNTIIPNNPSITLEYPNPFSDDVDPSTYTEIDSKIRKISLAKTSNSNLNNTTTNFDSTKFGGLTGGTGTEGRVQFRRVLVNSICPSVSRLGCGGMGNFEIILSAAAKDSGLWTVGAVLLTGTNCAI